MPILTDPSPASAPHRLGALALPAALTLGVLTMLGALLAPSAADAEVVNRVVLRVNSQIATLHEYQLRRASTEAEVVSRQEMPLQQRREVLNNLGRTVFRDLFEELLLLARADQLDIRPTESEVDTALARLRESFGFEDDPTFAAALAARGMRLDEFREQVRKNLRMQNVLSREVQSQIQVDEEVLRRYYRDHPDQFTEPVRLRLRELVVLEEGAGSLEDRRRMASQLHAEAADGRSLAELAEVHSADGTTSALIEIGWVSPGDLDPDLEGAVWGLGPGEVTEPVEARGGLHLIEVTERREPTLRPFAEVADLIRGGERQRRFADAYGDYLDRLEREAHIVAEPPPEAADFRRAPAGGGEAATALAAEVAAAAAAEDAADTASETALAEPFPDPDDPFADPEEPELPPPDLATPPEPTGPVSPRP